MIAFYFFKKIILSQRFHVLIENLKIVFFVSLPFALRDLRPYSVLFRFRKKIIYLPNEKST